jgi:hypothetical protein
MQAQAQCGSLSAAARNKILSHWLFVDDAEAQAGLSVNAPRRKDRGLACRTEDSRPFVLRRISDKEIRTGAHVAQNADESREPPRNASMLPCVAASLFSTGRDIPQQNRQPHTVQPASEKVFVGTGDCAPSAEGQNGCAVSARLATPLPQAGRDTSHLDADISSCEIPGMESEGCKKTKERAGLKMGNKPCREVNEAENEAANANSGASSLTNCKTAAPRRLLCSGGMVHNAVSGAREAAIVSSSSGSTIAARRRFSCPRMQLPAGTPRIGTAQNSKAARDTAHMGQGGTLREPALANGLESQAAHNILHTEAGGALQEPAMHSGSGIRGAQESARMGAEDVLEMDAVGTRRAANSNGRGEVQVTRECENTGDAHDEHRDMEGPVAAGVDSMVATGWATGTGRSVMIDRRALAQVQLQQVRRAAVYKEEE